MTMSWRTLLSLTCAVVVPFVLALSTRRSSRISLFGRSLRFAAHVHSICGVGDIVNLHLAEFSLHDLVAGLVHVAFFFQCSPARLVNGGYLRSCFFFFVAVVLSQVVRGERHEGTAFPPMRVRHSTCTSTCARDAREMGVRRRLWAKQVHRTGMSVERGVWDDTSRTAIHAHQKAQHTSTRWC